MIIDFKPSQVHPFARSFLPFIATFRKTEAEVAAGMLVGAMAHHGDAFAPMGPRQIGEWLKSQTDEARKWNALLENPFVRPNFDKLIEFGFARWVGDESLGRKRQIELTEAAIERLREKGFVVR